jgi:Lrp/AsnC ligand binding domain
LNPVAARARLVARLAAGGLGAQHARTRSPTWTPASAGSIKRFARLGVIAGYHARLSPEALGLDLLAFMLVAWSDPKVEPRFLEKIPASPDVLECHHITGAWNYILTVRGRHHARSRDVPGQDREGGRGPAAHRDHHRVVVRQGDVGFERLMTLNACRRSRRRPRAPDTSLMRNCNARGAGDASDALYAQRRRALRTKSVRALSGTPFADWGIERRGCHMSQGAGRRSFSRKPLDCQGGISLLRPRLPVVYGG